MKLASQIAFAAACTAVAADSYAVKCSKRTIFESPRVSHKQRGFVYSLASHGSLLKHQALRVRGGKTCDAVVSF
jgi:hypothetical protein